MDHVVLQLDSPSALLGGEACLQRIFNANRSATTDTGAMVSPWVEPGAVYNEEYRHTSLIATLREQWQLGDTFTQRDAFARTFEHVFSRATPRDPDSWARITARPVPDWTMDLEVVGQGLSTR
jgi:phospholipase C